MTTDTIITTDLTPAEAAHLLTALEKGEAGRLAGHPAQPQPHPGPGIRLDRATSAAPVRPGARAADERARQRGWEITKSTGGSASALAATATPLQATGRARSRS